MDPDPHGSGSFAWIRNSEDSKLDPEYIISDPQHWLKQNKKVNMNCINQDDELLPVS